MRQRRKRPEPLSFVEMGILMRALCGAPPYPAWVEALKAKADAWEKERERLKDPCGHLCKELKKKVPEVLFQDATPINRSEFVVRLLHTTGGKYEVVSEPVDAVFDPKKNYAAAVCRMNWTPERTMADVVRFSTSMLIGEPEWCEEWGEAHARRFLESMTRAEIRREVRGG